MQKKQIFVLEWLASPFSRGSSWPSDQTLVSCIAGGFFTIWATKGSPHSAEVTYTLNLTGKVKVSSEYTWHFDSKYVYNF